ncbi:MAG: hypothetical protein C4343_07385 [Chloroflexota bacterium]
MRVAQESDQEVMLTISGTPRWANGGKAPNIMPARLADLRTRGVPFDPEPGLEGGHARRRIHHVRGADTGAAIVAVLSEALRHEPGIEVAVGERVVALTPGEGVRKYLRVH